MSIISFYWGLGKIIKGIKFYVFKQEFVCLRIYYYVRVSLLHSTISVY